MPGLRIASIDHVSVLVTDLARSRAFYAGLLGLREIPKPRTFSFSVLWFDLGGQQLHLLLKPAPDAVSARHFALRVEDIGSARDHFRRHDIPIRETTPIPHCDRFFVSDPDQNLIEVIQWLRPYDPAESGTAALDGEQP